MGLFASLVPGRPRFKKVKEEGCVVSFSVEIPAAEADAETQAVFARLRQRARVPGFRPGKAPLDVVKTHFNGLARQEALDALLRRHVPAAVAELKLRLVESPSVEDVAWNPGEPVVLQVSAEVTPSPTAKDYLKIPVARRPPSADDAAVLKRLEDLREAHARLEAAPEEAVGPAHFAVIDYAGSRGGRPLADAKGRSELVDMSAEQTVAGLTEGLRGLKRGESKTLEVKLGGRDAQLAVTVREIKVKVLPALDAEFAKDLGFETLDQLKAKLREVLEREERAKTDAETARQIEEALVKANAFPLPPSLVERHLADMIEGLRRRFAGRPLAEQALADLRAKLRPEAESAVRLAFVLAAVADKEKISVADAELDAELEAELRSCADEAAKKELREAFARRREQIVHRLRERKTMAFLKEKAVYADAA